MRNLADYRAKIRTIPRLSHGKEVELARLWRRQHDQAAANEIVEAHLRLVVRIAREMLGYGIPLEELVALGNVGIMKALKKYDPERGLMFATYAAWWIRQEMQYHAISQHSFVKVGTTSGQRKVYFGINRALGELSIPSPGNTDFAPEDATRIAKHLEVSEKDLVETHRRIRVDDERLDRPAGVEGSLTLLDFLADPSESPETEAARQERRRALSYALATLNSRERHIFTERRLRDDPPFLDYFAGMYNISRERVRQIEEETLDKVSRVTRRALRLNLLTSNPASSS